MARGFARSRRAVGLRPVRLRRIRPVRSGTSIPVRRSRHRDQRPRRPLRSGRFHRVLWPAGVHILVIPELADHLSLVLEEFAQAAGSTSEGPLRIVLRQGTMGLHRSGRAVDIYEVGGKGISQWAQEWNAAMQRAAAAKDPQERSRIIDEEKASNVGFKLYKALQNRGGWAQPQGYPVQLFGPWTRAEGPHKGISDRLLRMHRDHIHVAK